jgi:hypothetical protein
VTQRLVEAPQAKLARLYFAIDRSPALFSAASAYLLPFSFMPLKIGPIALYFLWRLRHSSGQSIIANSA